MILDDLLDDGGAALLSQLRGEHHCPACSGSDDFCLRCGYALSVHVDRCPESEAEAVAEWGRS